MDPDDVMLTTVDNPWNPFTHWDEWREYDESAGWHTLALLGRVAVTSDEMSESDQDLAILDAMNEIVRENVSGFHVLVARDSERLQNLRS
ncbi:hypothetical protein PBI_CAMILLE_77 [Microbacterium phage Camille]|nr:hypothetical protein PBI_CAMILLE_77 [Microbacterium phage Camille]